MIFTPNNASFDKNNNLSKVKKDISTIQSEVAELSEEISSIDNDLQDYKQTVANEQSGQNSQINANLQSLNNLQEYTENYVEQNKELIETQVLRASEYVETPLIRAVDAEITNYDTALENINEHLSQIDDEQHIQNINIETNRLNISQTDSNIENNIERRLSDLEEKMDNEGSIPLGIVDTMRVNDILVLGETTHCSYEKVKELVVDTLGDDITDLGNGIYIKEGGIVCIKATENRFTNSSYGSFDLEKNLVSIDLSGNRMTTSPYFFGNLIQNGVLSYQNFGEEISQALVGKDTGTTKYNFYDDLFIADILTSTTPSDDDVLIHTFDVETETWKHWTYAEVLSLTEEERLELFKTFHNVTTATTNSFTFNKDIMNLGNYVTSENEEIDVTQTEGLFKLELSKKSTWEDSAILKAYCNEYLNCFESYDNVAVLPSPTFNCYTFVGNTLYIWDNSTWYEVKGVYGTEGTAFNLICPIHNFTVPAIPYSKREIVTYDAKVKGTINVEGNIKQTPIHTYIQKEVVFTSGTDYATVRIDRYSCNNINMLKFSLVSHTGIDDTSGSTLYRKVFLTGQETKELFGDITSKGFTAIFEKPEMKVFITPFTNGSMIELIPLAYEHSTTGLFTEYIVFNENYN